MIDAVIDDIVARALRLYPSRDARVGMRSAFADAACICDALAKQIERDNPGRSRGGVSQIGMAIAQAVRKAGDKIMAARDRIDVEPRGITHGPGSKIAREFGRPVNPEDCGDGA